MGDSKTAKLVATSLCARQNPTTVRHLPSGATVLAKCRLLPLALGGLGLVLQDAQALEGVSGSRIHAVTTAIVRTLQRYPQHQHVVISVVGDCGSRLHATLRLCLLC